MIIVRIYVLYLYGSAIESYQVIYWARYNNSSSFIVKLYKIKEIDIS